MFLSSQFCEGPEQDCHELLNFKCEHTVMWKRRLLEVIIWPKSQLIVGKSRIRNWRELTVLSNNARKILDWEA